jgi:hypothetical protein
MIYEDVHSKLCTKDYELNYVMFMKGHVHHVLIS